MGYIGNNLQQQVTQPATQFFSGNGSTTSFTLNQTPQSVYTVEVVVNNVQQNPQTSYYVTGNTLIFYSAPPSGSSNIYVNYNPVITQAGLPGYGTVNTNQLGVVTNISSGASNFTLQTGANNSTTLTVTSGRSVSIGNNFTPSETLHVSGSNIRIDQVGPLGEAGLYMYRGSGNAPDVRFFSSAGSVAAPTVSSNSSLAGQIHFSAYDGTSYGQNGGIYGQVDGSISTGTVPIALRFLTGTTSPIETMRIDSSGRMTRPYHPAFMVTGTGGSNTYSDGAEFNIGASGVIYNVGNGYSTSTGRYTAPVAGFYQFSYGVYSYVAGQLAFKKNGSTFSGVTDAIGLFTIGAAAIGGTTLYLPLAAGDTVSFGWRSGYSGNIYHGHSWFSGHLVG